MHLRYHNKHNNYNISEIEISDENNYISEIEISDEGSSIDNEIEMSDDDSSINSIDNDNSSVDNIIIKTQCMCYLEIPEKINRWYPKSIGYDHEKKYFYCKRCLKHPGGIFCQRFVSKYMRKSKIQ